MKNIQDFLDKDSSKLTLGESSILNINKKFVDFDSNLLELDIFKNYGFSIGIIYSIDNKNWSLPKDITDFEQEIEYYKDLARINQVEFYVHIKIIFKLVDESNNIFTQYNQNNSDYFPEIILNDLKYDGETLLNQELITIEQYVEIVKKFPSWNLYDNQKVTIDRWLSECVAVNNRIGHQCIYFKTEPNHEKIIETLSSITTRDVVSIKKIIISSPDNELPTDRNTFTEWDMPMIDDFIIHIPDLLFKLIFGNEIPSQKDFIYLPILNKLYTINSVQPGQKFMGVTGWWECYLIKYEEDENVSKDLLNTDLMKGITSVINTIPNLDEESISDLYNKFENIIDDGLITADKEVTTTIEEKKEVTNNLNNHLVDSTSYVSLKETENQRNFYNKRLKIVTINPDSLSFPLNMYDVSTVEERKIGLNYDLIDATKINKISTIINPNSKILLSFNFVLIKRFSSNIIDILYSDNIFLSLKIKGKNLILIKDTQEYIINYRFEESNFYQINITENTINICILENKQKRIVHIYEYQLINNTDNNLKITNINLYGGNYYLGQLLFKINGNKILEDKTLPVLNMNSFGL